jgi:cytochrome c553
VYTLALADGDGSNPHTISYHETQEWDPSVLCDGRVVYTRWDYVDRNAVFYQQLWSVRPDGSDVRIFYGNNTLNPVGIWEAKAVPGSGRIMATAAAHHAMTGGSIILIDPTCGVDGPEPITRLTPDALFPESEAPLYQTPTSNWHSPIGVKQPLEVPVEAKRWPGHCYRAGYPFSEDYFLAAYSFDRLIGEPTFNRPNMFGLYLVDRFGNKELLYRDLNISTIWAMPLVARPKPVELPSLVQSEKSEGTFFLQNVYDSWPSLEAGTVKRLRIVQVLPKSTPHANTPPVGAANASPGKQVLGTVPVEEDGSAYFRAPAGVALAFQALDDNGQAVQVMRSVTYLQPGETSSCIGCHEHRMTAPAQKHTPLAMSRDPSSITPGPDGSNPLCYPLLVQPVLDKACASCHNHEKAEGKVVLTGEPEGQYTVSYNALIKRVRYSSWSGVVENGEPATMPGRFGAINSPLMQLLRAGHANVTLSPEDLDRLVTWMDANALFYGTFNPEDQARQRRGERIAGPDIQ